MPVGPDARTRVERAVHRWWRLIAAVVLGAALAPVEAAWLVVCAVLVAPGLVRSGAGRRVAPVVEAGSRRLVELDLRRLALLPDVAADHARRWSPDRRRTGYLVARSLVGLLGAVVMAFLAYGLVFAAAMVWAWLSGEANWLVEDRRITLEVLLLSAVPGVPLLFINLQGVAGVAALEVGLARHFLGPNQHEVLEQRVADLATSRAAVVEAVNGERRRIERDLHDGVQQRLVALSMLLGRARRARRADQADALLAQAHDQAQQALDDLREVSWRIYPAALDSGGLEAALETVAERSGIPVDIHIDVDPDSGVAARSARSGQAAPSARADEPAGPTGPAGPAGPVRWDPAAEAVVYFVVSEAVTNAAKHSGAGRVTVRLAQAGGSLRVVVRDDGRGGADPAGTGLSGLARRVAALDGSLTVESPPGGPTTVAAELPCG